MYTPTHAYNMEGVPHTHTHTQTLFHLCSHIHCSITAPAVPSDSHVLSGSTDFWKVHFSLHRCSQPQISDRRTTLQEKYCHHQWDMLVLGSHRSFSGGAAILKWGLQPVSYLHLLNTCVFCCRKNAERELGGKADFWWCH